MYNSPVPQYVFWFIQFLYLFRPMTSLYFDYQATTPLSAKALAACTQALATAWGNPSSAHEAGRAAKAVSFGAVVMKVDSLRLISGSLIASSGPALCAVQGRAAQYFADLIFLALMLFFSCLSGLA